MQEFESLKPVLVFFGLLLAVGAVIAINVQGESRASERTARAAQSMADDVGLQFTPYVPDEWQQELPGCFLFNQGLSREACHRLTGQYRGWPIVLFELNSYDRARYGQSIQLGIDLVLVVRLVNSPLPAMQLLPLSVGERLAESVLGTERIVFDGSDDDQRFSREYSLWCGDRQAVESLFQSGLVSYFADRPGWHLWSGEGQVVIWAPCWRGRFFSATADEWRAFLDGATDVIDALTFRRQP